MSSTSTDRAPLGAKGILLIVVMLLMAGGGLWLSLRGDDETAEGPAGDQQGEVISGAQVPAPEPAQDPVDDPTTLSPEEAKQYTGTDVGRDYGDIPLPGFAETTDREPQPGDKAAAEEALETVVPGWASLADTEKTSAASWEEAFRTDTGGSEEFTRRSLLAFDNLWGGVLQMDVSAQNAQITEKEELWNNGANALWRVTVERDLVPNMEGAGSTQTEEVTWDFLLAQTDEESHLVAFADPDEENEEPETFRVPQE